jgi:hypothetical protein
MANIILAILTFLDPKSSKSRRKNEEKVNILGIRQNNSAFHIPLSFELIVLNFSNFITAPPTFKKIVAAKKTTIHVSSPDKLKIKLFENPYFVINPFPIICYLSDESANITNLNMLKISICELNIFL